MGSGLGADGQRGAQGTIYPKKTVPRVIHVAGHFRDGDAARRATIPRAANEMFRVGRVCASRVSPCPSSQ